MGLKEKITDTSRVRTWSGTIPVSFRYTAGPAGERFFSVLKAEGRFAVTQCPQCNTTYLPPRLYCRDCFVDLSDHWTDVEPRGTLHSFTVVHRDLHGRPLSPPQAIGFVAIAETNGGLLTPLEGDLASFAIGQTVEAVLREPHQRRGTIEDVRGFRVVAGQRRGDRPRRA